MRTQIMDAFSHTVAIFVPHPSGSAPHAKGVRYFYISTPGIEALWGAFDAVKKGQQRKKRIVVRPSRRYPGLHELYTYHFPKQWSKACQANRELIKTAQRLAHAIEKDHSYAALEWRIRHIQHLLNQVPGQKSYAHFYPFVYVTIYQSLRAASQSTQPAASQVAKQAASLSSSPAPSVSSEYVSFVPITSRQSKHHHSTISDLQSPIRPHLLPLHRRRQIPQHYRMCG
ncbi:MAG: hypothetical protein IJP76_08430 [Paludibacteraceae bacterium]|nr:hypothetical protein [Paludibacteraceae bacterium]